jgi:hypothetical protein
MVKVIACISSRVMSQRGNDFYAIYLILALTLSSVPSPPSCEVMNNKYVLQSMDGNLWDTYAVLPNLVYVITFFKWSCLIMLPSFVAFTGYDTKDDDTE